jgi:hypothetical protein
MRIAQTISTILVSGLVAACGGGSTSSTTSTPTASGTPTAAAPGTSTPSTAAPATSTPTTGTSTTISGAAVKGPVINGTVTIRNAATGAVLATTTTNASGSYSASVPFTGDVVVEVNGGTYTDESTNATTTLGTPMKVVLAANGGSVTGVVTPLTTMAYTNAFSAGSAVTSSAFNTAATSLANRFQLTGVNLATTVPNVSVNTTDAYGRTLRAVSRYLQQNNTTLQALVAAPMTNAQLLTFSTSFSAAYNGINGTNITFKFDEGGVTLGGTGSGGGMGTCGVNVKGNVSASGFNVPISFDYCITGIAEGSCSAGNSALNQAVTGQGGVSGGVNLAYTYSATCAAGAIQIKLQ